jgi:hypothetical protein
MKPKIIGIEILEKFKEKEVLVCTNDGRFKEKITGVRIETQDKNGEKHSHSMGSVFEEDGELKLLMPL